MLSRTSRDKMKVAVELVRKGAVMLAEPCQQCGGIQLRYHGKVYCANHDDLTPLLKQEPISYDSVVAGVRELLLSKLKESAALLENEKDSTKQDQLVSLMTKYFELLQKMPQK